MLNSVLRKIRVVLDMDAAHFSDEIQLSTSHLYALENGRIPPGIDILEKYSSATGLHLSEIFYLSELEDDLDDTPADHCKFQRLLIHDLDRVLNPKLFNKLK